MKNLALFSRLLNFLSFSKINFSEIGNLNFPGTYILILKVSDNILLRHWKIKKGFFAYVGSAKNGLSKRLSRHLKKEKRLFWHIDYLLDEKKVDIYEIYISKKQIEKVVAKLFERLYDPVVGFGNGDNKSVKGHLFKID
ncbi:MAG TPA: GIY-YIG nuclease family protein [Aquificae bacterium]|nr:GIY-YIG nuclease family protein [Aquificota bacterium]